VTGVRATVTVPADLVSPAGTDTPTTTTPAASKPTPPSGMTVFAPDGAPKFGAFTNGATNGATNGRANGATNGHANSTNGSSANGSSANGSSTNGSSANGSSANGSGGANGSTGLAGGLKPSPLPRRRPDAKPAAEEPKPAAEPDAKPEQRDKKADPAPESTEDKSEDTGTLPRRSPGARMPGPATGSAGRPNRADGDNPPPDGLFTPTQRSGEAGWWAATGPGRPVDPRALAETTPIFDEMISAWFRTISGQHSTNPNGNGAPPQARQPNPPHNGAQPPQQPRLDDGWRFAADSGFDAARAVSKSEPVSYTESGLPRRSAGQNLVPGSAGTTNNTVSGPPRHGRAAEDMRDRLSDYSHGVRRARDHRQGRNDTGPGTKPANPQNPQTDWPRDPGLDLTGAGWRFAADVGWHAANAVSTSTPVDFTSGGLPRRSAGQNLMPGSVEPSGGGPLRTDRAEELRGRLGSLQMGLSRGRRSLSDRGTNGYPENQQESE
jgi:hypothetical protein